MAGASHEAWRTRWLPERIRVSHAPDPRAASHRSETPNLTHMRPLASHSCETGKPFGPRRGHGRGSVEASGRRRSGQL
jgi:hypothetical protein